MMSNNRYRMSQNRLLKVCCVPATSAGLPRVSFFFPFLFFVAVAIYSTNKANKAGGTRRQAVYIFLDVYGSNSKEELS
jgi:hypothetical protein